MARAVVASGCEGAAHGVALDCIVVLLGGDDSEVVLELQALETLVSKQVQNRRLLTGGQFNEFLLRDSSQ